MKLTDSFITSILVNHVDFWDVDFQVYLDLAKIIDSLLWFHI